MNLERPAGSGAPNRLSKSLFAVTRSPATEASEIAILYLLVGILWIFGSDLVIPLFLPAWPRSLTWDVMEEWAFLVGSALLLFALVHRSLGRAERARKAQVAVEQAARLAEERFRTAFEGSAVPMAISGADGRFEAINPAFAAFLGVTQDVLVGRHFADVTHPNERERDIAAVREQLREVGDVVRREKRYVRADGSVVWGFVTATVVESAGETKHFIHIQNLEAQKEAERRLAESEAFFRRIVQETPVGIFYLDPGGGITFANAAAQRMTGRSADVLEGVGWVQAIHPEDRARVVAEWEGPLASAEPHRGSGRYLHSDGTVVWFEAETMPVKVGRDVIGQIAFVEDTTERHLSEASLRENEARLRVALRAGNHGWYDVDLEAGTAVVNDDYCRMLGFEPGAFRESITAWRDRLHPADRRAASQAFDDYVGGRRADYRVEYRQRTASGGWKSILSLGAIVERDVNGRPRRLVGTHTDIDAQRRRERALRLRAGTSGAVTHAATEQALLDEIARVAVTEGGYRLVWVGIPDRGPERLVRPVARAGEEAGYVDAVRVSWADEPQGQGPTGVAVRTGTVQVASDVARDHAFAPWLAAAREHGVRSSAAVPLIVDEQVAAVVNIYADEAGTFDAGEIALLQDLAREVAYGLGALRNREQIKALATHQEELVEAERARVSQELHDELGQALTGLKLDIAWLRDHLPEVRGECATRLDDMRQLVDGTVDTVRRISSELRPGVLDDLGLEAALRWLVRDFGKRAGATIRMDGITMPALDPSASVAAFHIVQEALTNAARYAPGAGIVVRYGVVGDRLRVAVEDDGPGFDPGTLAVGARRGLGLLGMRERARMHGGTLEVQAAPGLGTTISLELPTAPEA
jgi:PAS domain S-box-containing protein